MTDAPGPADMDSPRAQRIQSEDTFGARVEREVHEAQCRPADVARALGLGRRRLYESFAGQYHFRAAWIALLPPAVQLIRLRRWAGQIGYELRPAPKWQREGHCDWQQLRELVEQLSDVYRSATVHQSDGHITPDQAEAELREIEEAEAVLEQRKARLRNALAERGSRVLSMHGRG